APTDEFQTFHVNGSMPTARRERELRDFRAAARAVVSNARCLTEGVDVPAVDMVAFLSPRRSRVDIVQATGRAMRRSPGKTTGYVLVPLYLELTAGETVEAAVNRAQFDEVWDVLHSIQEQDDVLSELIRYVGEQKGQGKGFNDSGFADRIDFGGPRLHLEALRAAVTTHCLDNLYSSWDMWFGKLKAFKERFGHCNVETDWEEDPALAGWVSAQRTRRNKGSLYPERIRLLDELGFVWDFQTQKGQKTWMKWYRELEAYASEHGNPHVTRSYANTKLASWVWIQRQRRKGTYKPNGKDFDVMTAEQIGLLDKLSFRWDAHEEKWSENFEKLKKFTGEHGHCEVGLESNGDEQLADWTHRQRWLCKRGRLNAERKSMLETIGFKWNAEAIDLKWHEMFERLKEYHSSNGDANVPYGWKENRKLAAWVSNQRERRKHSTLSDEEIKLLDSLGFTWKSRDVGTWEDRLAEVVAFKAENGHCDIPLNFPENPKLGRFVNNIRTQRNSRRLSAERIAKLDAIGFAWGSRSREEVDGEGINAGWKMRFEELLRYKEKNGDCKVPNEWPENLKLGHWVNQQRYLKKCGELHLKREEMLNSIAFDWGFKRDFGGVKLTDLWALRFDQLVDFKNRNGHCNVPYDHSDNRQLGIWVSNQRQKRKLNKLTPERLSLLNGIGFVWEDVERGVWEERFQELAEFKAKQGHCDVPVVYPENSKLGWFTKNMRAARKKGTLFDEKIAKLDAIGFAWVSARKSTPPQMREAIQEPIMASWKKFFDELVAYKKMHGNCDVPVKWKGNPQLGGWAAAQRSLRKSGKLHPERERMLNEIGFDWRADQNKEDWETRFEQLKDYKQRFGNCSVPVKWAENPRLGAWVSQQRHFQKAGKLSAEKERLLTEIGFARALQQTTAHGVNRAWNDWFNELVQYKAKHGDCKVPTRGNENPRLGVWVSNQRQLKKYGKLEPERARMLSEIGFVWNLHPNPASAR
ncbi:MAG TPA: Helicase associated domain protein, partial [Verrucomicrobiae bacterium]